MNSKLTLKTGNHLLRITLKTVTNCGAAGGTAVIDSPTQCDKQFALPYIPDSTLKGVIAGCLGDSSQERERLYGRQMNDEVNDPQWSKVYFGNGIPVAIPIPLLQGGSLMMIPVAALATVLMQANLGTDTVMPILDDLVTIEKSAKLTGISPVANLVLADGRIIHNFPGLSESDLGLLAGPAQWLIGDTFKVDRWVIVGPKTAATLWQNYSELRTQTALISKTKTVKPQSLRRLELIPAGSVFVSYTSCDTDIQLETAIQVGAWENTGCGFVSLEEIPAFDNRIPTVSTSTGTTSRAHDSLWLMRELYNLILDFPSDANRDKARTIIREFGPRMHILTMPTALAFELAKARFNKPNAEEEARTRRWFLKTLLKIETEDDERARVEVENVITGTQTTLSELEIMQRWLLMRRLAETQLSGE